MKHVEEIIWILLGLSMLSVCIAMLIVAIKVIVM
jgi:hypothetical protein